jgi:Mce-associated membrane protein
VIGLPKRGPRANRSNSDQPSNSADDRQGSPVTEHDAEVSTNAKPPTDATERSGNQTPSPAAPTSVPPVGDAGEGNPDDEECAEATPAGGPARRRRWMHVLAFGLLPAAVVLIAAVAGYLKWLDTTTSSADIAQVDAVAVAQSSATAMLSYTPASAERDLTAAQALLSGPFRGTYAQLTHDVVIPGAKQKQVASQARVAAAAPVTVTTSHAVVLVFIDQTITMGADAPTDSTSAVRITLDKVGGRWLISAFDPV